MPTTSPAWSVSSWQAKEAKQQPQYPDPEAVQQVVRHIATLPPLVTSWEVVALKNSLAEAAAGQRFLLQGGDCAERFDECTAPLITNRLKILLQMSLVLIYGLHKPIIRVGRFAGQYAKPRSSNLETRDGQTLPSYRGDIVNGSVFTPESRIPDPDRMLSAYHYSALTINFVRALIDGGFADLHHPEYWNLDFADHTPHADTYHGIVDTINETIRFVETVTTTPHRDLQRVEYYTSHEALLLPYEQAQTRYVPRREGAFNLSTHMPWIGMRTADPTGAHVEFARGIRNPIGIKVGPAMTASWLLDLLRILNPDNEPGRITLITRLGADEIGDLLPPLIQAVQAHGHHVLWCCDPMHGNTETTVSGTKTRRFDTILSELEQAFDIHRASNSHLGGVHFELTGEDVTECVGGARGLSETDLARAYTSHVDPRLNYEQALEMALRIVQKERSKS